MITCPCCGATCNGNANDRKRFIRRHFGNEACHVVKRRELASAPTVRAVAESDEAELRERGDSDRWPKPAGHAYDRED